MRLRGRGAAEGAGNLLIVQQRRWFTCAIGACWYVTNNPERESSAAESKKACEASRVVVQALFGMPLLVFSVLWLQHRPQVCLGALLSKTNLMTYL